MTRLLFFCFFLVFLRPALADPPPLNGIYLGKSQILEADSPRQISLNAHVSKWDAQPGGLEIAYVGSEFDGVTLKQFVKLAGVKRGQTRTILTAALTVTDALAVFAKESAEEAKARGESAEAVSAEVASGLAEYNRNPALLKTYLENSIRPVTLSGWSADGKYLLLQGVGNSAESIVCVDVALETPRQKAIFLPTAGSEETPFYSGVFWSSERSKIALQTTFSRKEGEGITRRAMFLYDPATGRQTPMETGPDEILRGWLDDTHLLLSSGVPVKRKWFSVDITTRKETLLTATPTLKNADEKTPAPKKLTLTEEYKRVADQTNTATTDAHAIWIRRQNGPKILSAFPVALTPGPADPQSGWLPGGKRVAYVAHGDLFVVDLIVRPAAAREKLAAGESLTCAEERDLAISNVKQIVLGMLQWCQDNDEFYPPAAGVEAAIIPYTKDPSLFSVGTRHFVYTPPVNRSLAALENPATTIIGTIDLPCAVISAYADGHVKSKMKPGFE